jgi:hypothetical protein
VEDVDSAGAGLPEFIGSIPGVPLADRPVQFLFIQGFDVLPRRVENPQGISSRKLRVLDINGNGFLGRRDNVAVHDKDIGELEGIRGGKGDRRCARNGRGVGNRRRVGGGSGVRGGSSMGRSPGESRGSRSGGSPGRGRSKGIGLGIRDGWGIRRGAGIGGGRRVGGGRGHRRRERVCGGSGEGAGPGGRGRKGLGRSKGDGGSVGGGSCVRGGRGRGVGEGIRRSSGESSGGGVRGRVGVGPGIRDGGRVRWSSREGGGRGEGRGPRVGGTGGIRSGSRGSGSRGDRRRARGTRHREVQGDIVVRRHRRTYIHRRVDHNRGRGAGHGGPEIGHRGGLPRRYGRHDPSHRPPAEGTRSAPAGIVGQLGRDRHCKGHPVIGDATYVAKGEVNEKALADGELGLSRGDTE